MKTLLDYVFPISVVSSIPAASTAFLRQVAIVCKPKAGQEGNVGNLYTCVNMTEVAARTANTEAQQLFNAGMTSVMVLLASDLDLETYMTTHAGKFFSLLISSDFSDEELETGLEVAEATASKKIQDILYTSKVAGADGNDITIEYVNTLASGDEALITVTDDAISVDIDPAATTAETIADAIEADTDANALVSVVVDVGDETDIQALTGSAIALEGGVDEVLGTEGLNVGTFDGVVGVYSNDMELLATQAALPKRCGFFGSQTNKAKSMFYAFGKMLSTLTSWYNQQYIEMPLNDGITEIGDANSLFDDKVSFVLNDEQYSNRLALFAAGGKAIVAPYILKNFRIDLQGAALQWIALNQPQFNLKNAALLESYLTKEIIDDYVERRLIESGTIEITLVENNFVASGSISVPTPKALWRVYSEMTETN